MCNGQPPTARNEPITRGQNLLAYQIGGNDASVLIRCEYPEREWSRTALAARLAPSISFILF
jgi:hypothetical protein